MHRVIFWLKSDQTHKFCFCFQTNKAKVEIAEREKVLLQKELAAKGKEIRDKNDNNAMGVLGQGDNPTQK